MEAVPTPGEALTEEEMAVVPRAVLVEALRLAYQAGKQEKDARDEALAFIQGHVRRMQRSVRRARPTPALGVDAGLELILLAAQRALEPRP